MRVLLLLSFIASFVVAKNTTDCTAVFEQRKAELVKQIEKIDEARQAAEAVKAANDALYERKMKTLRKEQAKNEDLLAQIKKENKKLDKLNAQYKELVSSIEDIKNSKLAETYNKMKEGAAAGILEKMDRDEAANILFLLPPKKVSKIMAKMESSIASDITLLLQKGPPFKKINKKSK